MLTSLVIMAVVAMYVLSPVDAFPGPIDDMVVIILGALAIRGMRAPGES